MTKLNLEMGNTPEIVDVALKIIPDEVCLVPEKREEVTTEGGLDVVTNRKELEPTIKRLQLAGIRVSLFVDPTLEQIDAAHELGVEMVELHTGKLANAFSEKIEKQELENLQAAASKAFGTGIGKAMGCRNIDIRKKKSGEPFLVFSGPAQELATKRGVSSALITLSHTEHHAMACVVLEA